MKQSSRIHTGIWAGVALLLLILDAKTALSGAREGVILCIYTVVPSLFPFITLSLLITSGSMGKQISVLRPLGKICGVPDGAESLLIVSLLGGYPAGAQAVCQAYESDRITKSTAKRLLGFCNNAGPSFIFGMLGSIFSDIHVSWILWLIHFGSAILVGILLPEKNQEHCCMDNSQPMALSKAVKISLQTMGLICGWVILFRVLLAILSRWLLWLLPASLQVLFSGILELSNGCVQLALIPEESTRFLLAAVMLSFGGVCVSMQTRSVTAPIGTGYYFPGKILQCIFSLFFAGIAQHFLFPGQPLYHLPFIGYVLLTALGCLLLIHLRRRKKVVALCP